MPTRSPLRAMALLAPALVLLLLFKFLPIAQALIGSTGRYDFGGQRVANAGLENYRFALADPAVRDGLLLTVLFAIVKVALQLAVGLGAALLFQGQDRPARAARTLLVTPMVVPMAVLALLFTYLFDTNIGTANAVLGTLGLGPVAWFDSPGWARTVLVGLSVWRDAGLIMLVFLAGLAALPAEVAEAARLDGAGPFQLFRSITLPLLRRSVQFAVVVATLLSFQITVPVWVMTQGGPERATNVASYQVFEQAFRFFDFGSATTVSTVLLAALVVIVALEMWLLRPSWEY